MDRYATQVITNAIANPFLFDVVFEIVMGILMENLMECGTPDIDYVIQYLLDNGYDNDIINERLPIAREYLEYSPSPPPPPSSPSSSPLSSPASFTELYEVLNSSPLMNNIPYVNECSNSQVTVFIIITAKILIEDDELWNTLSESR
jgi:hypothetical protein